MGRPSLTRGFLTLFVISIGANAVLGIWALLSGDFGETQGKVLATSFLVSAAMLSILVNIPAIRRRELWPVPAIGAAAGASGFAMLVALVWFEGDDDVWFRSVGSLLVVAAAATLAASLSLIGVPSRLAWVHAVVDALIGLLAVTILYAIWFEPDTEWYARLVGIEAVLVAAMTLLVPVLSRFASPGETGTGSPVAPGETPALRYCPSCGRALDGTYRLGAPEPVRCTGCELVFRVETDPGSGTASPQWSNGMATP